MGVSKNRKDHKKKSQQRTIQIKAEQRKSKQKMLQAYLEQQRKLAEARDTQKTGEIIEDSGIDVDLDVDDIEILDLPSVEE